MCPDVLVVMFGHEWQAYGSLYVQISSRTDVIRHCCDMLVFVSLTYQFGSDSSHSVC